MDTGGPWWQVLSDIIGVTIADYQCFELAPEESGKLGTRFINGGFRGFIPAAGNGLPARL
jgi:hypothetical protein